MKNKQFNALVAAIAILAGSYPVWGGLIAVTDIQNVGLVKGVGITADKTILDWGKLATNDSKTMAISIRSASNIDITLNMTTEDLPPYLTLSWDLESYLLEPDEVVAASFTLTAVNAPQGTSFSFNIIITGTGS